MSSTRPWLRPAAVSAHTTIRLFCCAHAGGGAAAFNGWPQALPTACGVVRVQLPGREDNRQCPPARSVGTVIPRLVGDVAPLLDRPFALYGHSMGAIVMFELARALRRGGHPPPMALFVSGRRAPRLPLSHPPLYSLPDDALAEQMRRMGAPMPQLFDTARWREHYLPTIRADLELSDLYRYRQEEPLACPIHVFGGAGDHVVMPSEWHAWGEETKGSFNATTLPGGHFFDRGGQAELLQIIGEALVRTMPQPALID